MASAVTHEQRMQLTLGSGLALQVPALSQSPHTSGNLATRAPQLHQALKRADPVLLPPLSRTFPPDLTSQSHSVDSSSNSAKPSLSHVTSPPMHGQVIRAVPLNDDLAERIRGTKAYKPTTEAARTHDLSKEKGDLLRKASASHRDMAATFQDYCHSIGIEAALQEVLGEVLQTQPDPATVYQFVSARLRQMGTAAFLSQQLQDESQVNSN